ncbi:hypothetical protein CRG98_033243 [Punica granatum]|uniref:Uncharacterized protein n=1 Tax=Punica granatum TaxID=22663 RepID=A0A2I0IQT4_PUNGR|nr:hypothetical protein CRG98_033243 [Punica granatum]
MEEIREAAIWVNPRPFDPNDDDDHHLEGSVGCQEPLRKLVERTRTGLSNAQSGLKLPFGSVQAKTARNSTHQWFNSTFYGLIPNVGTRYNHS